MFFMSNQIFSFVDFKDVHIEISSTPRPDASILTGKKRDPVSAVKLTKRVFTGKPRHLTLYSLNWMPLWLLATGTCLVFSLCNFLMIFLDSEAESLLGGVFDNCGAETVADTQDATPAPSNVIENLSSSPKLQVIFLLYINSQHFLTSQHRWSKWWDDGKWRDDGIYFYCILMVNIF